MAVPLVLRGISLATLAAADGLNHVSALGVVASMAFFETALVTRVLNIFCMLFCFLQ